MSSDGWNEPDYDRWEPRPMQCQTVGCENDVAFPQYETLCVSCIAAAEERQRQLWKEIAAYEQVRRA